MPHDLPPVQSPSPKNRPVRPQAPSHLPDLVTWHPYLACAAVGVAALAMAALANRRAAARAERENPPLGKFVEVDGVDCTMSSRVGVRP